MLSSAQAPMWTWGLAVSNAGCISFSFLSCLSLAAWSWTQLSAIDSKELCGSASCECRRWNTAWRFSRCSCSMRPLMMTSSRYGLHMGMLLNSVSMVLCISRVFLGVCLEFHLIVGVREVNFGEDHPSLQALYHVLQRWNRVMLKVQYLVSCQFEISADADVSIWLVSHGDRAGILREWYLFNNTLFEHPVEMLVDLRLYTPQVQLCRRYASILSWGIHLGFASGQLAVYCILKVIIQRCS